MKGSGKEIFLMAEERKLGLNLVLLQHIGANMLLGRNMAKAFTKMGKSGGILASFLTTN